MTPPISKIRIVRRVLRLMEEKGTPKIKLGEILGVQSESRQARIQKADRFLDPENPKLDLNELNAIATFFERPVEYFLLPSDPQATGTTISGTGNTVISQTGNHHTSTIGTTPTTDLNAAINTLTPVQQEHLLHTIQLLQGQE